MNGRSPRSRAELLALATKALRRLSLYATLASHRVLGPFGHHDYVPFIVLTRSRTGSNLLLSFLNSHPNVFCEGEIFARLDGSDPLERLRRAFGKQPRHLHAKGFKIFYYHPLDADASNLWSEIERQKDIRIIHLRRKNILRTLLSRKIAGLKGTWTGTKFDEIDKNDKHVSFTMEELEDGFRQTQKWQDAAVSRFADHKILELSYEEFTTAPLRSYQALCSFLGLPAKEPRTTLSKQNPESVRSLIRNYDELKRRFAGSPWSVYFDE